MIEIGLDPNVALGPLRITWHGLFGLLAAIGGASLGIALVRPRLRFDDAYAIALAGILGGLAASRAFHVLDRLPVYLADPPRALAFWDGGESIVGGIVGGLSGGILVIRARRLPLGWVLDRGSIGLPFGMAIGRVGDVINGEHFAAACGGVPWCVRYTHPASVGQRDPVHPAVAYELILDLAIVGIMLALLPRAARQRRQGALALVFLLVYGAGRLALSAYRLDPLWIAGFTQAQFASALFVAAGVFGLAFLRRSSARA